MKRFKVEGMTCGHCAAAVRRALATVPGVIRVDDVSVERGEASVDGAPDIEAVRAALREEGYEAEPLP